MRILYTKSNVLRKRAFAINTSIIEEEGKKIVVKKAVYPEGIEHLKQICTNQELLKNAFPHVEINKVWLSQDELYAEFIDGVSLTSLYSEAAKKQGKDAFLKLFDWHLGLFSDESNMCLFEQTEGFANVFGDIGANYVGEPALNVMNFDTLSDNILLQNGDIGKPTFIDYEWVFDFPVPVSFLHYFIANALYRYIGDLEKVVTRKELLNRSQFYKANADYAIMWDNFCQYFRIENSLDLDRINERFIKDGISLITRKNVYIAELENSIAKQSDYLQKQQTHIEYLNGGISWYQKLEGEKQAHIEYLSSEIDRLSGGILWYQKLEEEKQAYIEQQNSEIEQLKESLAWHTDYIQRQQTEMERLNKRIINRLIKKIKG